MATKREYFLQLVNTRTKRPIDDDTGNYQVYSAGAASRVSIYDSAGTAQTHSVAGGSFIPETMANGQIHFWTDLTVSSVDISVLTAGGRAYFLDGVTPSQHRIDVDPEKLEYVLVGVINDAASSTALRNIGFQAKAGMRIEDVYVRVTATFVGAATGNNKVNLGITGDSNGFAALLNVTATGYKSLVVHSTTGKVFATQVAGELLANWKAGSAGTNFGWFTRKPYQVSVAAQLAFARGVALTASFTGTKAGTGKAYVFYRYSLDPTKPTAL